MTENEFLLQDRLQKIQQVIEKYGEENFYISFSGGKDSTVLHHLIDQALPGNRIPRVYANTGIEYNMIISFVKSLAEKDDRIQIITPKVNIKQTLEDEGYPFKSKAHSKWLDLYQRNGMTQSIKNYLGTDEKTKDLYRTCPKQLFYQFSDDFSLRCSDHCCLRMKEEPIAQWKKEHGKKYGILGVRRAEEGRRSNANCLALRKGNLYNFQPLVPVSDAWEEWYIKEYDIDICALYKPPYCLTRTGCKGCPFALHLQEELDMLEKFFPAERKQCEIIWEPVYTEYRKIKYRLKK